MKKLEEEEVSFLPFSNYFQLERRKLDAIEDDMHAEKRRLAIEKANKKMHD